jgi:hypothetical protein
VVRGPKGAPVTIVAAQARAGVARTTVDLA